MKQILPKIPKKEEEQTMTSNSYIVAVAEIHAKKN